MRLRHAANAMYQQLANHPDMVAVVDVLLWGGDVLAPVGAFIRGHFDLNVPEFADSLEALTLRLSGTCSDDEVQKIVAVLKGFYRHTSNLESAKQWRGCVVETLTYTLIKEFYDDKDCLLGCLVFARNNSAVKVTLKEVDICAWDNNKQIGEAYECKMSPAAIENADCYNLVNIAEECKPYQRALRIGIVSFEPHNQIVKRLLQQKADQRIEAFGLDDLYNLQDEFGMI